MPEPDLSAGYVTCSACQRIVEAAHVNRAGRCVLCAGLPVKELAAQALGLSEEEAQTVTVEPTNDAASQDADKAAARDAAETQKAAQEAP